MLAADEINHGALPLPMPALESADHAMRGNDNAAANEHDIEDMFGHGGEDSTPAPASQSPPADAKFASPPAVGSAHAFAPKSRCNAPGMKLELVSYTDGGVLTLDHCALPFLLGV